jgi:D-3-phosphoglycerate dehydrogenase
MQAELFKNLQQHPKLEVYPEAKNNLATIQSLALKAEILVVRSATKVNKELIDLMPKLKLVIRAGEGMDNIDLTYCKEKNILAKNTPGANGNAAAELAIASMFSLLRQTPWAQESMKAGQWDKSSFSGVELTGKTLGVVGFGKIGQTVAKRLSGFDVSVLYFDPGLESSPLGKKSTLENLFAESDLITLHLPLMDATKNLINKNLLQLMKPTSYLINCARGGIIQEEDLIEALQGKKIAGAALDVFAKEPLENNSALRSCPRLLLTPHLGATTKEAEYRVGLMTVDIIKQFAE